MEEIRNLALVYYKTGSDEFKKLAHTFFKLLATQDQDNNVTLGDLDELLKELGYEPFHRNLLKELGKSDTDFLDFSDVLAVYYVAVTKRPYCGVCQTFLKAAYFTCIDCLEKEDKTYVLCVDCFGKGNKVCPNGGHAIFLDNFAALRTQSKAAKTKPLKPKPPSQDPTRKALHDVFLIMEETYFRGKTNPDGQARLLKGHMDGSCSLGW